MNVCAQQCTLEFQASTDLSRQSWTNGELVRAESYPSPYSTSKLTGTRNSNDSTRSSDLETQTLRVSSQGDKELMARLIFFQIHVHVNLAGLLLKTEKF